MLQDANFGATLPVIPTVMNETVKLVDLVLPVIQVFPDCTRRPMKTNLRDTFGLKSLTLTAALLSAPVAAQAQSSVGDLEGYSNDVAAVYETSPYDNETTPAYAPISYSDMHAAPVPTPSSTVHIGSGYESSSCGCTATTSCDSGACKTKRAGGLAKGLRSRRGSGVKPWASVEALLWFPQARNAPDLITVAPNTLAPTLGLPNTQTVFGGEDGLGGELQPGLRVDAGRYLSENFGIGGRFWFLGDEEVNYAASGDGSAESLGRPFFDTNAGAQDSILVYADTGGGNVFAGSIAAESTLSLIGAEAYGRLNFASGDEYATDIIGGYSHFGIDDTLSMTSTSVETTPASGQTFIFNDLFEAENSFNGGQIGFETVLKRGKWMFSSLTKVHLGNMNSSLRVSGSSTSGVPPALTTNAGGALALDSIGNYERDVFTFAPEANVKLGYRFRDHVLFTVGYSFIYWDSVALAGDNINPVFDATTLGTAGPFGQPTFGLADSSFYVQGIDLGLTIDF